MRGWIALIALLGIGAAVAFTFASRDDPGGSATGPVHIHGLGLDPADGSLLVATHTGMWRLEHDASAAVRVGDREQDTMGPTVVGPGRLLASGHPDLRDDLPPNLGLIESVDGGATWKPVSLLGEADFHVLRHRGSTVYGYDATGARLLVSSDGGATWAEQGSPGPVADLAVHPDAEGVLLAVASGYLHRSVDGGSSWRALGAMAGLLAWPSKSIVYLVRLDGRVYASMDDGASFARRGTLGGEPAALLAVSDVELYVALHDGSIHHSADGGRSWSLRAAP